MAWGAAGAAAGAVVGLAAAAGAVVGAAAGAVVGLAAAGAVVGAAAGAVVGFAAGAAVGAAAGAVVGAAGAAPGPHAAPNSVSAASRLAGDRKVCVMPRIRWQVGSACQAIRVGAWFKVGRRWSRACRDARCSDR